MSRLTKDERILVVLAVEEYRANSATIDDPYWRERADLAESVLVKLNESSELETAPVKDFLKIDPQPFKLPGPGHFQIDFQLSQPEGFYNGRHTGSICAPEDGHYTVGSQPPKFYKAGELIPLEVDPHTGRPK